MSSSDLAAASIAAGANMNSTLWTNAANEEMQQQQNKWNLEQWNRNNAYNHPAAQMQRLKAAGLNPDLLYGQNAGGAMGNSASPAQGTQPIPKQPFFLDPTMFAQLGLIDAQKKNVDADTQLKLANAEGKQQENYIQSLDVLKTQGFIEVFKKNNNKEYFQRMYENWVQSIYEEADAHKSNRSHYNANYWENSGKIATLFLMQNGIRFADTALDEKGGQKDKGWRYTTDASGEVTGLEQFYFFADGIVGNITYEYENKIRGELANGNLEFVQQQFQILVKQAENLDQDKLIKQAQNTILGIEEKLKKQELKFQEWFNSDEEISILGIRLTPREFCVVAPVLSGLLNAGGEVIQGLGNVAKSVVKGKGKPAPTTKNTYNEKHVNVYNYGVPQH